MKTEIRYTYEKEDIIAIVLSEHEKKNPAPSGMKWKASEPALNYRDEMEIKAVPIKAEEPEEVEA